MRQIDASDPAKRGIEAPRLGREAIMRDALAPLLNALNADHAERLALARMAGELLADDGVAGDAGFDQPDEGEH